MGGTIKTQNDDFLCIEEFQSATEFQNLCYENTCTIDYFLLGFWAISRLSKNAMDIMDKNIDVHVTKYLKRIIELIEINEWDRARTLWVIGVMKMKPINWKFDLFGFQSDFFINYIMPLQELRFYCESCQTEFNSLTEFFLTRTSNKDVTIYNRLEEDCPFCKNLIKGQFKRNPFCIFFSILSQIDLIDIPPTVTIDFRKFNLICLTFHSFQHFKSLFYVQKSFYLVDDLLPSQLINSVPNNPEISYILYFLE